MHLIIAKVRVVLLKNDYILNKCTNLKFFRLITYINAFYYK